MQLLDKTQSDEILENIRAGQRRNNYFHDVLCGRIPADPSRNFAWEDAPKRPSRLDILHRAILTVQLSGSPVDVVTVADQLQKQAELARLGGLEGLMAFVDVHD